MQELDVLGKVEGLLSGQGITVNQLRPLLYERGFVYNVNGHLIAQEDGNNTSINFYRHISTIRESGYTLIHNHPVEDWGFSIADLQFAIHNNLREIIAISPKTIYYLKFPQDLPGYASELIATLAMYIQINVAPWKNRGHLLSEKFAEKLSGCIYKVITL